MGTESYKENIKKARDIASKAVLILLRSAGKPGLYFLNMGWQSVRLAGSLVILGFGSSRGPKAILSVHDNSVQSQWSYSLHSRGTVVHNRYQDLF